MEGTHPQEWQKGREKRGPEEDVERPPLNTFRQKAEIRSSITIEDKLLPSKITPKIMIGGVREIVVVAEEVDKFSHQL